MKKQPAKQELQHLTDHLEDIGEKYRNLYDSLHESTAFIELSKELAVTANEAETSTEALRNCIDRVARFMGWPVGHVYFTKTEPRPHMVPSSIWYLPHLRKFSIFKKITEKTPFAFGKGLPGRILKSRKPAWIIDVMKDKNFPRNKLAKNLGVKAGFGFPVLVKKEVVAVMEFFAEEAIEPDHRLLKLMEQIGTQLGRIMEREETARAITDSESKVRALIDTALDAVIIMDGKGVITDWNKQAEAVFGYKKNQAVGKQLVTLIIPGQHRAAHKKGMARYLRTGEGRILNQRIEITALRKNGEEFPVELTVSGFSVEREMLFGAFVRDITARKAMQEELVMNNERLDSFMNSATDHFIIFDKDLNVIETNEEAVEYFQAPKEELLGMNITELSPGVKESGRYDEYMKVIKTGEPFFVNDFVPHPSLGYLHLNVKAFKVGEGLGIIASDITSMREAIDELTNFMYRVSHDLKSPLATLMGLANLAVKESGTDRDQYIGMMCNQATKMDDILTDLVELTKVKQGEITPTLIDLPALCADAINSTSHTKGFEQLTINANWELKKKFYSDKTLILLILQNLIDNAIKYRNTRLSKPKIDITAKLSNGLLKLQVRDNGIGIPDDKQPDVFKLFIRATERASGTGIGLYTVKNAVHKLEGSIVVQSKLKKGTTFTIYLPNLKKLRKGKAKGTAQTKH